jgi:Rad3-related DNA helicase
MKRDRYRENISIFSASISQKSGTQAKSIGSDLYDFFTGSILQRDLNLLNAIFSKELGRDLKVAVLKGRSHYLLLGAWDKLLRKVSFTDDEIRFIIKVLIWMQETETGERSEMYLNREEQKVWYRIASDSDTCLGSKCWRKHECFVNMAREKAKQADLIIVNQALLLTDARAEKGIIPEYDYLVVDEAQHLEEVATDRYTQVFTTEDLAAHLKELDDLLGSYLNSNQGTLFSDQRLLSNLSELRTELKNLLPRIDILEGLIGMLAHLLQGKARNNFGNDLRINKEIENYLEWKKTLDALKHLEHNLELISDAAQELASGAFKIKDSDTDAEELTFAIEAWNEQNAMWQIKLARFSFPLLIIRLFGLGKTETNRFLFMLLLCKFRNSWVQNFLLRINSIF